MKFRSDDVVAALELNDLLAGELVPLVITGTLMDGTPFETASDCIRLVPPGKRPGLVRVTSNRAELWVDVGPLDLTLDGGGFGDFSRKFPNSTVVTLEAPASYGNEAFNNFVVDGVTWPNGVRTIQLTVSGSHSVEARYVTPTRIRTKLTETLDGSGGFGE